MNDSGIKDVTFVSGISKLALVYQEGGKNEEEEEKEERGKLSAAEDLFAARFLIQR